MREFKTALLESLNENFFTRKDALDAYYRKYNSDDDFKKIMDEMREKFPERFSVESTVQNDSPISTMNNIPEPTEKQKIAGKYDKADICISGVHIKIENPSGSIRGSSDGAQTAMSAHYGYFDGTIGADGDGIDCFVSNGTPLDYTGPVFIVDQVDSSTGKFDEHKCIVGVSSKEEAETLYMSNYEPDWKGLASISELTWEEFTKWLSKSVQKKPFNTNINT